MIVQTSMIVPVDLSLAGTKEEMLVYCILDIQNNTSFITKKTYSDLNGTYINADFKLFTNDIYRSTSRKVITFL